MFITVEVETPEIGKVCRYLINRGWTEHRRDDTWAWYDLGNEFRVEVPLRVGFGGFERQMRALMEDLSARVEKRSMVAILSDIEKTEAVVNDTAKLWHEMPRQVEVLTSMVERDYLLRDDGQLILESAQQDIVDLIADVRFRLNCEYGKLLSEERNGARNKLEKVQVKLSEAIRVISAGPWFDGKDEWIDSAKAMMTERTVAE